MASCSFFFVCPFFLSPHRRPLLLRMQRSLARQSLILPGLIATSPVNLMALPVRLSIISTPRCGWARRGRGRRLLGVFARFCSIGGRTRTHEC